MGKYSDDIVKAYINGDSILEYSTDELENDTEFMIKVIESTNDKKMYSLCSESVKVDKEFVRYVVTKFSDDIVFVTKVANKYFNYLDVSDIKVPFDRISMAKLMADITCCKNERDYRKYCVMLSSTYNFYRSKVDLEKRSADYNANEDNLGYGFEYFQCMFGNDESLMNYFAQRMVMEILGEEGCKLDDKLHYYNSFSDISDLDGEVLDFLAVYDNNLANYLCDHIEVLHNGYDLEIGRIKKDWNNHVLKVERDKYDRLLTKVHNIFLNSDIGIFPEEVVLVNLGIKYDIVDKIAKYSGFDMKFADALASEFDDVYFSSIMECSSADKYIYEEVERLIKEELFGSLENELVLR